LAIAERFRVAAKPAFPTGRALTISRQGLVLIAAVTVVALVLWIFSLGHPVMAVWLAAAFCGWAFIFGAARVSEANSRPLERR
jgi:uncharacterized membrane protein